VNQLEVKQPKIKNIIQFLGNYLHGKDEGLRLCLLCLFTKGHILIEDLPGLGKTTLAIGIAKSLGMEFGRIQCTNDLLPSDITGLSIFNKDDSTFKFQPGPIFNNIVLVDEVNRATPKTQSALLEAMGEKQVTVEGNTYKLKQPFFVMATQNPLEQFGTFPLPEAQMDRFMMKISLGYPSREAEWEIVVGGSKRNELYQMEPIMKIEEVLDVQDHIKKNIKVSDAIYNYILDITQATRNSKYLKAGVSTRATLFMVSLAKANAYFNDREFVIPEDVTDVSDHIISHRVLYRPEFESMDQKAIAREIVSEVKMPV